MVTLKDQVWNRVHEDYTPSEGSSIHSSLIDTQNDCLITEDPTIASFRQHNKDSNGNMTNNGQELPSFSKSADNSVFNSEWLNKKRFSDFQTEIKNDYLTELEQLSNGIAEDEGKVLEGKKYVIKSTPNDLDFQGKRFSRQKRRENNIDCSMINPPHSLEVIVNDIGSSDNPCGIKIPRLGENLEVNENLEEISHANKFKELVAAPDKETYEDVSDTESDGITEDEEERKRMMFRRKKEASLGKTNTNEVELNRREDLERANQRMLEEEDDDEDEPFATNNLIKSEFSCLELKV